MENSGNKENLTGEGKQMRKITKAGIGLLFFSIMVGCGEKEDEYSTDVMQPIENTDFVEYEDEEEDLEEIPEEEEIEEVQIENIVTYTPGDVPIAGSLDDYEVDAEVFSDFFNHRVDLPITDNAFNVFDGIAYFGDSGSAMAMDLKTEERQWHPESTALIDIRRLKDSLLMTIIEKPQSYDDNLIVYDGHSLLFLDKEDGSVIDEIPLYEEREPFIEAVHLYENIYVLFNDRVHTYHAIDLDEKEILWTYNTTEKFGFEYESGEKAWTKFLTVMDDTFVVSSQNIITGVDVVSGEPLWEINMRDFFEHVPSLDIHSIVGYEGNFYIEMDRIAIYEVDSRTGEVNRSFFVDEDRLNKKRLLTIEDDVMYVHYDFSSSSDETSVLLAYDMNSNSYKWALELADFHNASAAFAGDNMYFISQIIGGVGFMYSIDREDGEILKKMELEYVDTLENFDETSVFLTSDGWAIYLSLE